MLLSKVIKDKNQNGESTKLISLRNLSTPIIDVDNTFPQTNQDIEEHLVNVNVQAEHILNEAQQKANEITQEAEMYYKQKLEEIAEREKKLEQLEIDTKVQAEKQGYETGYATGLKNAEAEYDDLLQQAKEIVNTAKDNLSHKLQASEPFIIKLAIETANKILKQTIMQEDDETSEKWKLYIKELVEELNDQENIKISVHPKHFQATSEIVRDIERNYHYLSLYVYSDKRMKEDDCVIETPYGQIEASVDQQIMKIKDKLIDFVEETSYE